MALADIEADNPNDVLSARVSPLIPLFNLVPSVPLFVLNILFDRL